MMTPTIGNKIEAIKAVRLLCDNLPVAVSVVNTNGKAELTTKVEYPALLDTKNIVEAIMDMAVRRYIDEHGAKERRYEQAVLLARRILNDVD